MKLNFLAIALLGGLPAFLLAQTDTHNGQTVVANQVIVRMAAPPIGPITTAAVQALQNAGDADIFRTLSSSLNLYLLHSKSQNVQALLAILKYVPNVVYVDADYVRKAIAVPNDTYFNQQWSMLNTSVPGADIGATKAWDVSVGSTANVIGVVDTGVSYAHPDLAANIWS